MGNTKSPYNPDDLPTRMRKRAAREAKEREEADRRIEYYKSEEYKEARRKIESKTPKERYMEDVAERGVAWANFIDKYYREDKYCHKKTPASKSIRSQDGSVDLGPPRDMEGKITVEQAEGGESGRYAVKINGCGGTYGEYRSKEDAEEVKAQLLAFLAQEEQRTFKFPSEDFKAEKQ